LGSRFALEAAAGGEALVIKTERLKGKKSSIKNYRGFLAKIHGFILQVKRRYMNHR
jgi:hypothetical protein